MLFSPEGNFEEMDNLLDSDESMNDATTDTNNGWSDFCKHCIYGSLDGLLTTFAIVVSGAGASVSTKAIFVLGISNIAADSLNMGLGDALSAISHHNYVLDKYSAQKSRLRSKKKRDADIVTLTEIYERKGLSRRHASAIVHKIAKYDSIFVQTLMTERLGLEIPEPLSATTPYKDGLITFMSFGVIGFFPIFVHCILPSIAYPYSSPDIVLRNTCILTLILLFGLGVATSFFSGKSSIRCGLEFLLMGTAVFLVAYFVAHHICMYIT